MSEKTWRCFHCDEVFTDAAAAADHFGTGGPEEHSSKTACLISDAEIRAMETDLVRHLAEDTDLHRQIRGMEADHAVALRRAEEEGYARGLRDYTTLETERDDLRAKQAETDEVWLNACADAHGQGQDCERDRVKRELEAWIAATDATGMLDFAALRKVTEWTTPPTSEEDGDDDLQVDSMTARFGSPV